MSGGVDSSIAAALFREQNYAVHGVFMQTWQPDGISCVSGDDRRMAARVAAHLNIPFAVWDFRDEYKRAVVDYMMAEYAAGRTPNPDVMCNNRIKFGVFLKRALVAGADYIATGHYIRLMRNFQFPRLRPSFGGQAISNFQTNSKIENFENLNIENSLGIENCKLKIAKDINKDQSYFLWTLTQEQLRYCLFPLGDYEKPEVRAMARERKLPNWDKKDSQGLCFVGKINFADFLHTYLPHKEGFVLTTAGIKIGDHDGAQFVTIGQRHGLGLSSKYQVAGSRGNAHTQAHYVVEKDITTNTIMVAEDDDPLLYRKEITANNINWVSGNAPRLPLQCLARVRYRQPLQYCQILFFLRSQEKEYRIVFDKPQRAIAPGQSVVFYTEEGEMLGGGMIA